MSLLIYGLTPALSVWRLYHIQAVVQAIIQQEMQHARQHGAACHQAQSEAEKEQVAIFVTEDC